MDNTKTIITYDPAFEKLWKTSIERNCQFLLMCHPLKAENLKQLFFNAYLNGQVNQMKEQIDSERRMTQKVIQGDAR